MEVAVVKVLVALGTRTREEALEVAAGHVARDDAAQVAL